MLTKACISKSEEKRPNARTHKRIGVLLLTSKLQRFPLSGACPKCCLLIQVKLKLLRGAFGYIAQWLERLTADQQVPGSNPGVPSSYSFLVLAVYEVIDRADHQSLIMHTAGLTSRLVLSLRPRLCNHVFTAIEDVMYGCVSIYSFASLCHWLLGLVV